MKPPIADPFAPPSPTSEAFGDVRIFRQSFWRVYFGTVQLSLLLIPIFLFFSWLWDRELILLSPRGIVLLLLSQLIFLPLTITFAASLHPVKVSPAGVQITVLQGFIEWSHIRQAGYFCMGLSYIRLSVQGRLFKIWLPLTLRDTKSFARAVEEWAPPDNPLRLFLQKRGF